MQKVLTWVLLIFITGFSSLSIAQQTINDGVYTQEQVEAGQNVYADVCGSCHGLKFYKDIWKGWVNQSLVDFWSTIVSEMPSDNPGSLLDEEYTNIVANILSDMGFPAGNVALDPNQGMDKITIIAP